MIIERTQYYAKPGLRPQVLEIRREACRVRVAMGLAAGSITTKQDDTSAGPDVAWSLAFTSSATHERDLAMRAASPEFASVRARMTAAIERFDRFIETTVGPAGFAGDLSLEGVALVPREETFWSADHALKGYLYLPPGPGPWPAVIYNHGSGVDQGSTDSVQPAIAARLMSWGIACFMPHRRGYGNSPGPTWRAECPDEPFTDTYNTQLLARLDRESDDVCAARQHLSSLPEIIAGRIAVMGSSFGGVNTLFAAAKDTGFRCAVEFAGAAMNWDRNPVLAQAMVAAAERLTMPIFFIQAANDFSIRPTQALAGTSEQAVTKIYPAFGLTNWEGHLFAGRGPQIWGPDVRDFLERYL